MLKTKQNKKPTQRNTFPPWLCLAWLSPGLSFIYIQISSWRINFS